MKYGIKERLHPDTADLVERFAAALALKLYEAQVKHGYTNEWKRPDWQTHCRLEMHHHIEKGDPRDVAAYCAFMWHHNWPTHDADREQRMAEYFRASRALGDDL